MSSDEIKEIVDLFNKRDTYLKKINYYLSKINLTKSVKEKEKLLRSVYLLLIKASREFYIDKYTIEFYEDIKNKVMDYEEKLNDFIVPYYPKYKYVPLLSHASNEEIIEHIMSKIWYGFLSNKSLKSVSFTDRCMNVSFGIELLCDYLGIECERHVIFAGFDDKELLYFGTKFHYFNIITINHEKYLVDGSYRQFFRLDTNVFEKVGVYRMSGCYNGVFMNKNEDRLRVTRELLTKGYIKIDDNVLKAYMDGFALSFRNGFYYEETNDYSFTTPYTADDYMRFINGEDSQVKHEGTEVLGFQIRPLKRPLNYNK